tara:strand:- start:58 stop:672 length:615 start_codon:yes stop_codon:yes gene_type:complete
MNESYESGSGYDFDTDSGYDYGSGSGEESRRQNLGDGIAIFAILSICIFACFILICRGMCLIGSLIAFSCDCRSICKKKYNQLFSVRPILPIKNDKLSKQYVNKMKSNNKSNFIEHYNTSQDVDMTCGICMDKMNISRQKIIYLNCGHIFHHKCIQSWVKTNIRTGETPSCPKCRICIIDNSILDLENEQKIYYYSSDSDTDHY